MKSMSPMIGNAETDLKPLPCSTLQRITFENWPKMKFSFIRVSQLTECHYSFQCFTAGESVASGETRPLRTGRDTATSYHTSRSLPVNIDTTTTSGRSTQRALQSLSLFPARCEDQIMAPYRMRSTVAAMAGEGWSKVDSVVSRSPSQTRHSSHRAEDEHHTDAHLRPRL